jgi:hypothetical protein
LPCKINTGVLEQWITVKNYSTKADPHILLFEFLHGQDSAFLIIA